MMFRPEPNAMAYMARLASPSALRMALATLGKKMMNVPPNMIWA